MKPHICAGEFPSGSCLRIRHLRRQISNAQTRPCSLNAPTGVWVGEWVCRRSPFLPSLATCWPANLDPTALFSVTQPFKIAQFAIGILRFGPKFLVEEKFVSRIFSVVEVIVGVECTTGKYRAGYGPLVSPGAESMDESTLASSSECFVQMTRKISK
jgi:hypothetical protein